MTTRFENPLQMLRLLKGAPLSVLYGLCLAQAMKIGPVGQEWLERHTGYTDKPISQALALLEEYGIARRNARYGWVLESGAIQLPLMNLELDTGKSADSSDPQTEAASTKTGHQGESRRISDSEKFRLSSSGVNPNSRNQESPEPQDSRAEDSEKIRINLAEFDRYGIREPARRRLAKLEHVTPALIQYHCRTSERPGQAIYRIENNWPVAEGWTQPAAPAELLPSPTESEDPPEISSQAWDTWQAAMQEAEKGLSRADFETWIKPGILWQADGEEWDVRIANSYGLEKWAQVKSAIEEVIHARLRVEVGYGPY